MERITGTDAANLMEAYAQVYAPQEITEEQIWEEVEAWVNSLMEEGYDLSEYTWEDMYEAYLNEAPMTAFQAGGGSAALAASAQRRNVRGGGTAMVPTKTRAQIETQGQQNLYKAGGGDAAIRASAQNRNVRGGGTRQVPTLTRQDIINRGAVAAGSTPRPAAPALAPRPAAPAPAARPAAPAPAARPAAPTSSTTPAPARPATPSYAGAQGVKPVGTPLPANAVRPVAGAPAQNATFSAPEKTNILGNKASELAALQAKAKADTLAKKQTTQRPMGARERMLNQDVDLFDIVKGHLMSEGYADTEEAALQIMANMSEEWKQSIVEGVTGGGAPNVPPAVAKFVDELPSRIQTLFGKPTSTAKPTPKRK